jgi:2-methylcitrate dehydratase PrpD
VKEGIPWSTFTGLLALDLADQGLTGPTDILDHPSYYDRDKIVEGLGKGFAIEKVYFKPYSCCRWSHSALDALLQLMVEHGIGVGEIHKVDVHTFSRALRLNNAVAPESLEAAQYSVPFSLAVAALDGERALLPMQPQCLGRPELISFARKVELHVDPDLDRVFPGKAAARVVLQTGRGNYEKLVVDALGDPANPLDLPSLERKFRTLSQAMMSHQEQDEMIETITHLDTWGYRRFLELLRKAGSARE